MKVEELYEEVVDMDHVGDIHTANPEYPVLIEALDPSNGTTLIKVTGVRWDHNEGVMILETA